MVLYFSTLRGHAQKRELAEKGMLPYFPRTGCDTPWTGARDRQMVIAIVQQDHWDWTLSAVITQIYHWMLELCNYVLLGLKSLSGRQKHFFCTKRAGH